MRFATPQGNNSGDQFFNYLRDASDVWYEESAVTLRMISIGLHCRLIGYPRRLRALEKFITRVRPLERLVLPPDRYRAPLA